MMSLTLKLLNGSLQGRVLKLPEGPLTLGSGDVDLQVAFEQDISLVSLQVTESGVALVSPVSCWVEGRVFSGGILPVGRIIDLAGLGFVLLNDGESFIPRVIPERLAPGRWRLSRIQRRIMGAVLLSATLLVGCIALYWWQHQETVAEQVDRLGVQRWLVKQHQTPALKTLGFDWLNDGTVRIYGECLKQDSLERVLQILRTKGVFWHLETLCQDRLVDDVSDLLSQNGYLHSEVLNGHWPGEVRIRGDIRDGKRWDSVVRELEVLPGLKHWDVVSSNTNREQWLTILRASGFLGRLNMEKRDDRLIVSGLLSGQEQQHLQTVLQPILKSKRLRLILQNIPPRSAADDEIFPLPITSIGGSVADPYLTLTDGRRLQAGAVLNQGFEIANIDPQRGIDVYRDGQLLHISLSL